MIYVLFWEICWFLKKDKRNVTLKNSGKNETSLKINKKNIHFQKIKKIIQNQYSKTNVILLSTIKKKKKKINHNSKYSLSKVEYFDYRF